MFKNLLILLTLVLSVSGLYAFDKFQDPNPSVGNNFGKDVLVLSNGNVAITSPGCDYKAKGGGAVYLFNGKTGELISSLYGDTDYSSIGNEGLVELNNGKFLIKSVYWKKKSNEKSEGAITIVDSYKGLNGIIDSSNSLYGHGQTGWVPEYYKEVRLSNGALLIINNNWSDKSRHIYGAVTLIDGSKNLCGPINEFNSLLGGLYDIYERIFDFVELSNGKFVLISSKLSFQNIHEVGAITLCDSKKELTGIIGPNNSLIGVHDGDRIGSGSIYILRDGSFLVLSPDAKSDNNKSVGAITFANSEQGLTGYINKQNSLYGTNSGDGVGQPFSYKTPCIIEMPNANYLICTPKYNNSSGAVTFVKSGTFVTGEIGPENSLIGGTQNDSLCAKPNDLVILANGNYVVSARRWDNFGLEDVGAVVWCDGKTGKTGYINSANALIGISKNDLVGDVKALKNGNYVVVSPSWDNDKIENVGAVTFCNGQTGLTGTVNKLNSFIGSYKNDFLGGLSEIKSSNFLALSSGDFVVTSPLAGENGYLNYEKGAVTQFSGTKTTLGAISPANSLFGNRSYYQLGLDTLLELNNGNYVVVSPTSLLDSSFLFRNNGGSLNVINPKSPLLGYVDSTNTFCNLCNYSDNRVKYITYSNGDILVIQPNWWRQNSSTGGAITLVKGDGSSIGYVNTTNSLVGEHNNDAIGSGSITTLENGKVVICSPYWNNGDSAKAGAITLYDPKKPLVGFINKSNSFVGSYSHEVLGWGFKNDVSPIFKLNKSNFLLCNSYYKRSNHNVNALALTYCDGDKTISGEINESNSLIALDRESHRENYIERLNADYVILKLNTMAEKDQKSVGSITFYPTNQGLTGTINSNNSIIGNDSLDLFDLSKVYQVGENKYFIFNPAYQTGTIKYAGALLYVTNSKGLNGNFEDFCIHKGTYLNSGTIILDSINKQLYLSSLADSASGQVFVFPYDPKSAVEDVYYNKTKISINPNPCSETATLAFNLPEDMEIFVNIFDIMGNNVKTYKPGFLKAGFNNFNFKVQDLSIGKYIIKIQGDRFNVSCDLVIDR